MPGPVLVGFDASDQSQDALALGRMLAATLRTELLVGSVLDYVPANPITAAVGSYETAVVDEWHRMEELAREHLTGNARFVSVAAVSAAQGLVSLAEDHAAGIIVVGSTHRGAFGRVTPGGMADRLLSGSETAVAVAPRGYADSDPALDNIGVGHDGSADSSAAVAFAAFLAEAAAAVLEVVRVIEPVVMGAQVGVATSAYVEPAESVAARRADAERDLGAMLSRLSPKVEAYGSVELGRPAEELSARTASKDLFVTGSRGYGPVRRVLLGSVSAQLIRASECPMLVVPRGDAESDRHRVRRATGETAVGLVPLTRT
jgi:nucleotide-binding universal stress UspA family protein